MQKGTWFIILAVTTLALAALACGEESSPTKIGEADTAQATEAVEAAEPTEEGATEAPPATNTPLPEGPKTYEIGDVISIGDSVMVVLGWESPEGDEFTQPDEGSKFVAVELLLVNQSDEPRTVSSLMQMSLKDDTDQQYDVDLMAEMAAGSSSPQGELSPGERIRGKVGFQVPEDASGLVFVYDADVFGTGKVFVELGDEPVFVEAPSELAGETQQQQYSIGEQVAIGDMALTVNEVTYPSGDEFTQPDEGNKFVVVDLTLENMGSEAEQVSSMMQMSLKDDTGQTYDIDLMASMASGGSTPEGEISPGEKLRGQVGFQVPEDATGLAFVFDASVFGHGKVQFRLTD